MSTPTLKKLAVKIQDERKKRGFSQESFAHKIGVHRTYIGMIERAEKNITIGNLEKIAKGTKMHAEFEMDMAALTEGIAQDPALFDINVLNIHYFIESIKGVMRNVYNSELKILTHEGIDVPMSSQANALNNACRLLDFIAREPRETYYIGELIEQEVLDSDKWKTYWDACTDKKKRMENAGILEYLLFSSGKQMTIQINPKYL